MKKADLIVILGSPNADDGRLFDVAIDRCRLAIKLYQNNPQQRFILTGGFGEHFNVSPYSHAQLLEQYLIHAGIAKIHILAHVNSLNTIEDATLSEAIIRSLNPGVVTIVTSDYHADRAKFIFSEVLQNSGKLVFQLSSTDPAHSELDIRELSVHEKRSLVKLKRVGIAGYYGK